MPEMTTARFEWKPVNTTRSNVQVVNTRFVFKKGSHGGGVKALQMALTTLGIPTTVDGTYGKSTAKSVALFQSRAMLKPDGIAGPQTVLAQLAATEKSHSLVASIAAPASPTVAATANVTLSNLAGSGLGVKATLNAPMSASAKTSVLPSSDSDQGISYSQVPQAQKRVKVSYADDGNADSGEGDGNGHGLIASPFGKNPADDWPWGVAILAAAFALATVKKSIQARFS